MSRSAAFWTDLVRTGSDEQLVDHVLEDLNLESRGRLIDLPEGLTTKVFLRLEHMASMLLWEVEMSDEERQALRKDPVRLVQIALSRRGRPREAVALHALQHDFFHPHREEWRQVLAFLLRVELYRQLLETAPRRVFAAQAIPFLNQTERLAVRISDHPDAEGELLALRIFLYEELGFNHQELGRFLPAAEVFRRAAAMTDDPDAEIESVTSAAAALFDADRRQDALRLLETVESRLVDVADPETIEGWQFLRERLQAELGGQRLRPERHVTGRFDALAELFDDWLRSEEPPDEDRLARVAEIMQNLKGDVDLDKEEDAAWSFKLLLDVMMLTPADRRPERFLALMAQAEALEDRFDNPDLKIERRILLARQRAATGETESALEIFARLWPRVQTSWSDARRLRVIGYVLQALFEHGPAGRDDLICELIDHLESSLERELDKQPGPAARDWIRTLIQRPLECALKVLVLSAEQHDIDSDSGQALLARAWDLIMLTRNPELRHGSDRIRAGDDHRTGLEARFHRALRRDLASTGIVGEAAIAHLEALLKLEISTVRSSRSVHRDPARSADGASLAFFQIRETLSDKPLIVLCNAESRLTVDMIPNAWTGLLRTLRTWRGRLATGLTAEHTDTDEVWHAARRLFGLAETAAPAGPWHLYPDGPLYDLPMELLPDPSGLGACLGQKQAQQSMLRVSMVGSSHDRVDLRRGWFGLGDVPAMGTAFQCLPGTGEEIEEIETGLKEAKRPVTHLLRQQATVRNFCRRLGNAQPAALHFACHGVSHSRHPECCALILAPEPEKRDTELLPFRRIRTLDLRGVDLVVLSACASLVGRSDRSAGMKGLTWAFLEAGATRVLASRYRVKDSAAAVFMASFYRHLPQHPILEALRLTRDECLHRGMDRYQLGAWTLWS